MTSVLFAVLLTGQFPTAGPDGQPQRGFMMSEQLRTGGRGMWSFQQFKLPADMPSGKTRTIRAKQLMSYGDRAKKAGQLQAAVSAYWMAMRDYGDMPETKDAEKRLLLMGLHGDERSQLYLGVLHKAKTPQ
jgi:hypothetical protein